VCFCESLCVHLNVLRLIWPHTFLHDEKHGGFVSTPRIASDEGVYQCRRSLSIPLNTRPAWGERTADLFLPPHPEAMFYSPTIGKRQGFIPSVWGDEREQQEGCGMKRCEDDSNMWERWTDGRGWWTLTRSDAPEMKMDLSVGSDGVPVSGFTSGANTRGVISTPSVRGEELISEITCSCVWLLRKHTVSEDRWDRHFDWGVFLFCFWEP